MLPLKTCCILIITQLVAFLKVIWKLRNIEIIQGTLGYVQNIYVFEDIICIIKSQFFEKYELAQADKGLIYTFQAKSMSQKHFPRL